jgi:TDG/mug DNA glycosylase family protein
MPVPRAIAMPSAVPDVLAPGLDVVFCGINPGRWSDAHAAHFANPRNDFWRLLHAARLTPRLLDPSEQFELLAYGIGVTNAAYRTTPGSGDLRKADFEGSAERLGRLAAELRPRWIGFVGKEAYRGAFGGRPEHGLQERMLAATSLFVLPSTSPANAAVPWHERLRWFQELAGRVAGGPVRDAVRAVVVDPHDRVLLVRFVLVGERSVWASPGGGLEPGESDVEALRRELAEECGLDQPRVGPVVWTREHRFGGMPPWGGQRERHYLVRAPAFEPVPRVELGRENVHELRWFSVEELSAVETAPRRLQALLHDVLRDGPPAEPWDAGV